MTVTDEGRRLLEGATAGPWHSGRIGPTFSFVITSVDRYLRVAEAKTEDAELIVWLRNHADYLLDAVEALRELYDEVTDGWGDDYTDAMRAARAALAPFTEEPSDAS